MDNDEPDFIDAIFAEKIDYVRQVFAELDQEAEEKQQKEEEERRQKEKRLKKRG